MHASTILVGSKAYHNLFKVSPLYVSSYLQRLSGWWVEQVPAMNFGQNSRLEGVKC